MVALYSVRRDLPSERYHRRRTRTGVSRRASQRVLARGRAGPRATAKTGLEAQRPTSLMMTITTLGQYLCGNRSAILRVAASPDALWLGGLLVISAGLAREYD